MNIWMFANDHPVAFVILILIVLQFIYAMTKAIKNKEQNLNLALLHREICAASGGFKTK